MFKKGQKVYISKEIKTPSGGRLPHFGYFHKESDKHEDHLIINTGPRGGGPKFRVHKDHVSPNKEDSWMTKKYPLKEAVEKAFGPGKVKNKVKTDLGKSDLNLEAYLFFGRFNPPTKAHQKIVEEHLDKDIFVYLSHSEDEDKNPIPYAKKLELVKEAFPGAIVVESEAKNPLEALTEISEKGYTSVTILGGEDRAEDYDRFCSYNGDLFKFEHIIFECVGERAEDGISASMIREAIRSGEDFLDLLPEGLQNRADEIAALVLGEANDKDRADYTMVKTTTPSGKKIWRKQRHELEKDKKERKMPMDMSSMNADDAETEMPRLGEATMHPKLSVGINSQVREVKPASYRKDMQKLMSGHMDIATFKKKYGVRSR